MDNTYDHLHRLFERLKSVSIWDRIFGWRSIRNLMVDAAGDLSTLRLSEENALIQQAALKSKCEIAIAGSESRQVRITALESDLRMLTSKHEDLVRINTTLAEQSGSNGQTITELSSRKTELELELSAIKVNLQHCEENLFRAEKTIIQFQTSEEARVQKHEAQSSILREIQENLKAERQKEINTKTESELLRMENLKLTWSTHETGVKQFIKAICNKHTITYVETVPFKGEPDNTLHIADEYIVFDAKSPRGEDLAHFPAYIKEQSEKVRKYAKEENVKKWIFFVVPVSTLEALQTFVYPLADYTVFVITTDALEPVILSLKKIEEYDFADQMNPEDRENICRVLGRFAHLSKRRIQIDTYFINQFMELAYKSESDLPPDILEKVMEFEKAEKLNPPQEKRAKSIPLIDLQKSTEKLRTDTISKGIVVEDAEISTGLNALPLYRE